jgi:hypothetical protein
MKAQLIILAVLQELLSDRSSRHSSEQCDGHTAGKSYMNWNFRMEPMSKNLNHLPFDAKPLANLAKTSEV